MATVYPSKKKFMALSRRYNIIPVFREILADLETPVSCLMKMRDKPYSFLLESVEGGERIARYSFIGSDPFLIFKSKGMTVQLEEPGKRPADPFLVEDPISELQRLITRFRQAPVEGLPSFCGGAVGYFGYDMVRFIEEIPDKNPDEMKLPDSLFIFTDTLFVFDHIHKKIKIISNVRLDHPKSSEKAYEEAVGKINRLIKVLDRDLVRRTAEGAKTKKIIRIQSNFSKRSFKNAVAAAKHYIKNGDIIQVVLSQAFKTRVRSSAFSVYRALRSINPSPYMFYLNCGNFKLVGSSPEVHVRCENRKAMLRPIAGTRPRGKDEKEDLALEKSLLGDPKERAEHVMLVDLGRNDLGRVCDYSTVKVPEFMVIERYSHVMHIVSLVEGRLRKGKNIYDLLRATFPAGTISGAPKIRAMEIIDELENRRRGIYSGVIGYFSFSGNLDSCITIRTILMKGQTATVQAGAGIVADSDPEKEYRETQNKARALFKAIEFAESGGRL